MVIVSSPPILRNLLGEFRPCFSKPQFRNFSRYVTGLIACENGRNVQAINGCFLEAKDQSSLNRFLTESPWPIQRLRERRLQLVKERVRFRGSLGYLILDDSLCPKTGRSMEGAGYHYSATEGRCVWSHSFVSSHYMNSGVGFPVDLRLYVKEERCTEEGRPFKTKIQLATELVKSFEPPKGTRTIVLFDSWYFCHRLVEAVEARGFDWVTEAKSNRIVYHQGRRMSVTRLAETLSDGEFEVVKAGGKTYRACALHVEMPKMGEVKLVVLRDGEGGLSFIATNRLNLSAGSILEAYGRRWGIETFYRDSKQHLGLGGYQLRKAHGVIRHWHLVLTAYTLLVLARAKYALKGWIKLGLQTIGDLCRWIKNSCLRTLIRWIAQQISLNKSLNQIYQALKI